MALEISAEPIVLVLPSAVFYPPGDVTGAEWAALVGRVVAIEGLGLLDLSDVEDGTLADGMTIVYDADDAVWRPGTVQVGVNVDSNAVDPDVPNATAFSFRWGLRAPEHPTSDGMVVVQPNYGTTANTIAEGNHAHGLWLDRVLSFAASGALSSGTRTLISSTITGLTPANTYAVTAHLSGDLQGQGSGAGYTLPRITLNGVARDRFGQVRTVAGVNRSYDMHHPGVSVSGVSSITVSATLAYQSGDPINVEAGELAIRIASNR